MLGNLIENAAKYGSGRVFVTVERNGEFIDILIEDDGPGIPEERRAELFGRGARLDTSKPGTGLGLSIVRDVVEIYGGKIILAEKIGRAHVRTPVTNAHLVCRLLLEKKEHNTIMTNFVLIVMQQ